MKRVGFAVITVVALLAIFEWIARVVVAPPDVLVHQEHESLITVGGLPALNDTMEYDPVLFWRLKDQLDDHEVTGTNGQYEIDFNVSVRQHLRGGPPGDRKQHRRILVLGDSCAFGVGVEDDQTWPSRLEEKLRADDHDVKVVNAGVPGYTAYQGLKYLESNIDRMQPDVVLCCFGFNDLDTWASRSDLETAEAHQNRQRQSELFSRSRLIMGISQALHRPPPDKRPDGPPRPRLMPAEFVRMLTEIRILCHQSQARLVLLIWPTRAQIASGDANLALYQLLSDKFGATFNVPVINLVPEFLASKDELFVDHVHANEVGCNLVAATITESVSPMLLEQQP